MQGAMPGRRWYLLAYDNNRQDWRIFRIDRVRDLQLTGARTPPRVTNIKPELVD